jgi:outer membrane protein TolC
MRAQWIRFGGGVLAASLAAYAPAYAQTTSPQPTNPPLGATLAGLIAAGNDLSPVLQAAALDTQAAAARAGGAGALDDPTVSDSYEYYNDNGVFSAHTVMVSQSFPLWGKRSLRRQAALADVDASRGAARAAKDALDENIEDTFAQYYMVTRDIKVNQEVAALSLQMLRAASVRFGEGEGDQTSVIQALGEQTATKIEAIKLQGEKRAAQASLNTMIGRPEDAPLAEPLLERPMPAQIPGLDALVNRARSVNPTLSADNAAIDAAHIRKTLADKAWYPDLTASIGPLIQTNNRPPGFAATIGFNIPVPWGREASGQQEAGAYLDATQQRYDAAWLDIDGALGEALANLNAAMATETLLRREIMPQARANYQAVLASYSQGKGNLTGAIEAEHQMHDTDLRLLQAQYDEQVQRAAIERLIGGDL